MVNYTGIDYEAIVHQIDSCLTFISQLGVTARAVCKVEQNGLPYVLKVLNANYYAAPQKMALERRVLAATAGIDGMTHLIKDYGRVGDYEAILKQYFEGTNLSRYPQISPEIRHQLEGIISRLHSAGLAGIRFGEDDVIISPEGEARLIELDYCLFQKDTSSPIFEESVRKDLTSIRELRVPADLRVPAQYDP